MKDLELPEFPQFRGRLKFSVVTHNEILRNAQRPITSTYAVVYLDGREIAQEQVFMSDFRGSFDRLANTVKIVLGKSGNESHVVPEAARTNTASSTLVTRCQCRAPAPTAAATTTPPPQHNRPYHHHMSDETSTESDKSENEAAVACTATPLTQQQGFGTRASCAQRDRAGTVNCARM